MQTNELFRDKNGRPVQVGDVLIWEAQIGTVRAPVLRYADFSEVDPNNAPYMSKMWQRVILVRLPHGKGHLFAHDVARSESEAANVQPK